MAEFVQLKIYFELEQEVRRFNIPVRQANNGTRHPAEAFDDQGQAETLYGCIVKKIKDKLHHGNFRLTWKDSNGDSILFDSDEELQVALVPSADGVGQTLAIYVKTSTPPDYQKPSASLFMPSFQGPRQPGGFVFGGPKVENPHPHGLEKHSGVLCDGCDQKIVGTRYKCLACPDYDLCLKCEFKGVHCEHDSVAIRKPNQLEWRKLFAARESTYGRNRPLGTTRSQDGPVVELDLNLNQPLESLLRDVNTQVQKVLKGFMPQSIPEATVMTVTKTEAPPVVEVKDRQETLVETVVRDEAPIREKASADDQVEILHEIVVEQGTAKLDDKVATESIYPQLATATEQAETISLAESRRSSSPNLFSVDSSDDEDWALVSDNVSMTSKDAMAEIVETPSMAKDSPSAQIEAALTAMGEMGFKNEGNLLRALLENFHGDIGKVLDTIGN